MRERTHQGSDGMRAESAPVYAVPMQTHGWAPPGPAVPQRRSLPEGEDEYERGVPGEDQSDPREPPHNYL